MSITTVAQAKEYAEKYWKGLTERHPTMSRVDKANLIIYGLRLEEKYLVMIQGTNIPIKKISEDASGIIYHTFQSMEEMSSES